MQHSEDQDTANLADFFQFADDYIPSDDSDQNDVIDTNQDDLDDQTDDLNSDDSADADKSDDKVDDMSDDVDDNTESNDDESSFDKEAITGLYNQLLEEGIITVEEGFEFDGTAKGLDKALDTTFENLKKAAQESLFTSLPDDVKNLVEFSLNTGQGLNAYQNNDSGLPSLDSLDLDDEETQEKVLRDFYSSTTNYSKERIEKLISRAKQTGDLDLDAKDAYRDLLELKEQEKIQRQEQINQQKIAYEETQRQERELFENLIKENKELDDIRKGRVRNFIINKSRKRGESNYSSGLTRTLGLLSKNPEHIIQLGDLLLDYDPNKGLNLDRITNKTSSKKTKEALSRLDKALDPASTTRGGSSNFSKRTPGNFDWKAWAKQDQQ